MLLRICLIIAILGGGGVVAVNFVMVKKAMETTVTQRDTEQKAKEVAQTDAKNTKAKLATTSNTLVTTTVKLTQTQGQLKHKPKISPPSSPTPRANAINSRLNWPSGNNCTSLRRRSFNSRLM
jgi:hypothetical protein